MPGHDELVGVAGTRASPKLSAATHSEVVGQEIAVMGWTGLTSTGVFVHDGLPGVPGVADVRTSPTLSTTTQSVVDGQAIPFSWVVPSPIASGVHAAVLADGRERSGATVHVVTEDYDEGPILAAIEVPVLPGDDVASLGERVRGAERELVVEVLAGIASEPVA